MTENPKSLNLIQRALDRKSSNIVPVPAAIDKIASTQIPPLAAEPPSFTTSNSDNVRLNGDSAYVQTARLNLSLLRRNGMITPDAKTSSIANEFRNIKRKVLAAARDQKMRELVKNLVMVTSTLPQEGKTFTSMNLALSLAAERDVQVLLIDCDLIRPSIRKFFEQAEGPGMADILRGNISNVEDAVWRCDSVPNLSVIFAGRPVDDSPELMSSGRMRDFLMDISKRYRDRIIVIDTPPALTSFEPSILAQHVDQTVMVVSAQLASRHQIEKALDGISACHNISMLFNRAPKWEQKGDGYYYNYAIKADSA